jgi:hypothetical protein
MQFVNVGTKPSNNNNPIDYFESSSFVTKHSLISLISGLRQKEFGYDTLFHIRKGIKKFKDKYFKHEDMELFVDSGGYSIIVGEVPSNSVNKFIDCYNHYLNEDSDNFDYIFSLDIPINLKEKEFNTYNNIYEWNKNSLNESKKILENNKELCSKFYFVNHFKMFKQYDIWKRLYEELEYNKLDINFGIGGMVSLRGIVTTMDFSPFIGPCFLSLYYYLTRAGRANVCGLPNQTCHPLRIHTLGIYPRYDRLALITIEKLFQHYFNSEQNAPEVKITYDTINYERTSQLRVRDLEIFQFREDHLYEYENITKVSDDIINQIYHTDTLNIAVKKEIENLKSNQKLNNISAFAPLNIYSNLEIDKYFNYIVDNYNIIDKILNTNSSTSFDNKLKSILGSLNTINPTIFTPRFISSTKKNLLLIYKFNHWYTNDKSFKTLDNMMKQFIKLINFPADLD